MARIPGLNTNFDNITAATISNYVGRTYENHVPSQHPFLFRLFQRGNVKKGHGYKFVLQFRYPSPVGPAVVGVADGFQNIPDPVEMGGFTAYEFTPAMFAMNVAIEEYDEAAQGEYTTIIDYYQAKIIMGMDKFQEFYNQGFWGAEGNAGSGGSRRDVLCSIRTLVNGGGTSTTGGGFVKEKPKQLTAAVGTTPLTLVGGIERNQAGGAYECPNLWNPNSADTPSVQLLGRLYNNCILNGKAPDFIIMPELLYGYYDSVIASQQRYGESELAKIGFEAFRFKGADVVFDDLCPSSDTKGSANTNEIFVLSTEHFFLYYNTMKPRFVRRDYPNKPLKNYMGEQILQLCSNHLGRRQARHAKVADPS